jgi:hypothetical protein
MENIPLKKMDILQFEKGTYGAIQKLRGQDFDHF